MSWSITFPNEEAASGLVHCTLNCEGEWDLESVCTYEKDDPELPLAIKDLMSEDIEYAMVMGISPDGSSNTLVVNDSNSDALYQNFDAVPSNFIVVAWCNSSTKVEDSQNSGKGKILKE